MTILSQGLVSYTRPHGWRPPLPVSMAAILNFGNRPTSDNVNRVIYELGMVENMGVEVGIATPSLTVEKLFPLPVSVAAILNSADSRHREMLRNV